MQLPAGRRFVNGMIVSESSYTGIADFDTEYRYFKTDISETKHVVCEKNRYLQT